MPHNSSCRSTIENMLASVKSTNWHHTSFCLGNWQHLQLALIQNWAAHLQGPVTQLDVGVFLWMEINLSTLLLFCSILGSSVSSWSVLIEIGICSALFPDCLSLCSISINMSCGQVHLYFFYFTFF